MSYSVTVIIPTYNSSEFITKPIKSVANQSYKVNKIIIVDDNSADIDKLKLKLRFLKKEIFANIELIVNKKNSGPGYSRNLGWSKSDTDLIAFLDDDDVWSDNKLSKQIEIFKKIKDIDLVTARKKKINQKTFTTNKKFTLKKIKFNSLLFKNFITTSTVVVKRSIKSRFLNTKYAEDYYLWLSILKENRICYFSDEFLCTELDIKKKIKLSSNLHKIRISVNEVLTSFYNDNLKNNIIIFLAKVYNNSKISFKILLRI